MGRSSKNVSCRECRSNKKGCSREVDGCTGCRVRGIPCIYPVKTRNLHIQDNAASLISDKVSNEELGSDSEMQFHLQGSSAVSGPFIQTSAFFEPASLPSPPLCKTVSLPLIRIMQVLDSPLIVEHDEWMLEDPDLMPTYDDFRCVHAFITFNPRAAALMSAMDIQAFITTFFLQPAPLRLVICAIAAYHAGTEISEESALWFFRRARKAVVLSADRPSVATAKAYYWIYIYARIMRKDELGLPFLKMALHLIRVLELDEDPDYLPSLNHLNSIEKEERRRVFWGLCTASRLEMSRKLDSGFVHVSPDRVKPMGPIPGIFGNQQSSAPVTNLIGVIVAIKKFHTVVPLSLEEIIESPKYETLETQLGIVKSKIPDTLLLPLESPNDITNILCTNDGSTDGFVVWLNLDVLCSATLLHRPKLYMTSLKCATPRLVLPQVRNKLIKVIDESCAAVFGAKLLIATITKMSDYDRFRVTAYSSLWYSLLEITISAWFLVCRIQKEWAELVKYDNLEMIEAADLFTGFTRKFMKQAGMIECAVPMMECMLKEMQSCAGRCHPASNEAMTASSRRDIEGKNESGGYYAYLGLLGLDIVGGKQWDEGKDDAWRGFWKRNGMV